MSSTTPDLDDVNQFVLSVDAGAPIFREGDTGTEMYIIRSGEVELLREYGGEHRSVAKLATGEFFGEMSLLEDLPREISARAVSRCELLRIDAKTFDRLVNEVPDVAIRMLRRLCHRLREYQDHEARAAEIAMGSIGLVKKEPTSLAEMEATLVQPFVPAHPPTRATAAPSATPGKSAKPAATTGPVLVHSESGTTFVIGNRTELTVGRLDQAGGFTPDIDLSPFDGKRTLGRRHAKIVKVGADYFVREDAVSRNGTFVNDVRLPPAGQVKLTAGARIRFGLVKTVFEIR